MKGYNILRKIARIWYYVVLFLVGAMFVVFGTLAIMHPQEEMLKAQVTITEINETGKDADGASIYEVIVRYNDTSIYAGDATYSGYSSWWKVDDELTVQYDPEDPSVVYGENSGMIVYLVTGVGVIAVIASVILGVKAIKTDSSKLNELDRVDMNQVSEEQIREIANNNEEEKHYIYHFCGKLNQSYVLETPEDDASMRTAVYKADCLEFPLFRPYSYNFIDCRTGSTTNRSVSHTITTSAGTGSRSVNLSVIMSSRFKYDGENCWDFLARNGYSLEPHLHGLKVNFDVMHYGVKVAYLESAGANAAKGKDYKLGELPTPGVYRVTCKDSDLEMVFYCCFNLSRISFT